MPWNHSRQYRYIQTCNADLHGTKVEYSTHSKGLGKEQRSGTQDTAVKAFNWGSFSLKIAMFITQHWKQWTEEFDRVFTRVLQGFLQCVTYYNSCHLLMQRYTFISLCSWHPLPSALVNPTPNHEFVWLAVELSLLCFVTTGEKQLLLKVFQPTWVIYDVIWKCLPLHINDRAGARSLTL